jgi:hypothetical protein
MNAINTRAAALAVLVTIATLGGLGSIANTEHRQVVAAARQPTVVAAAQPTSQVQQVVIVGRRGRI